MSTATSGMIFVTLGVDFPPLGHRLSETAKAEFSTINIQLEFLSMEAWSRPWWPLEDATDLAVVAEFQTMLDEAWNADGLPFILAAGTPESLGAHIAATGSTFTVELAVNEIARPLASEPLAKDLVERGLFAARTRQQWRYLERDAHPLESGLEYWAWLLRLADEVGAPVSQADLAAAHDVYADAASGKLLSEYHTGTDEAAARYLAERLDVDLPRFAPITPHDATC